MSAASSGGRRRLRPLWRIAISVLVLGALLVLLPYGKVAAAIGSVPVQVWPLALLAHFTIHFVAAIKWRTVVGAAGATLPLVVAARCHYGGLFGNLFLPSVVGGDVVRAGLALRGPVSKGAVVLGSLADRAIDMAVLCAMIGVGALLAPRHLAEVSPQRFLTLAGGIALAAAAGAVLLVLLPPRVFPPALAWRIVRGRQRLHMIATAPGPLLAALGLSIAIQFMLAGLNAWLGRSVGLDAPFAVWLFVWPLAKIAALLPVAQGGIGVREAALVALFAPFGVSPVLALAAGLVFEAVLIGGGLVGGGVSYLLGRRFASARSALPSRP
jgi:uncharacterized membrane protein YbhN (UPF0104 family)